jgi:hypothetical protein
MCGLLDADATYYRINHPDTRAFLNQNHMNEDIATEIANKFYIHAKLSSNASKCGRCCAKRVGWCNKSGDQARRRQAGIARGEGPEKRWKQAPEFAIPGLTRAGACEALCLGVVSNRRPRSVATHDFAHCLSSFVTDCRRETDSADSGSSSVPAGAS